mgnify:FL=1
MITDLEPFTLRDEDDLLGEGPEDGSQEVVDDLEEEEGEEGKE